MSNIRKIILSFALGQPFVSIGFAQQQFYSQLLQNLYYSLPSMCQTDTNTMDTVVWCRNVVPDNTLPIVYCFDENNVIEHVGYRFRPTNDTVAVNNVIIRFIERELLSLLLTKDINQKLTSYRENGLIILLNDRFIGQNILQDKKSLLNLLKNNKGITIQFINNNEYAVSLRFDKAQKLSFHFPADSELITGMDKMERDVRLAIQLKNHKEKPDSIVTRDYSYLQLLRDSIYVDKGGSFIIPQINNDLYYIKVDSVYNLALDKSLIAESFANALLVPVKNNYEINITHRMYGKTIKIYTVSSRDFDDYFRRDFDRYFGIESLKKEKLTGTLVLNDRNAGSIHLAYVSVSLDALLNGGTMEIQLYSNIPQHNIKTLFGK